MFRFKKQVIIIVAVIVIGCIGTVVYFLHFAPLSKSTDESTSTPNTQTTTTAVAAHQQAVTQQQTKIDSLVATGNTQSIAQADQVANSQVATADTSGDDAYIVSANLAKAQLLIDTKRAQEALDSVLLPLDQKYGKNDTYKYQIDSYIGEAYNAIGNADKAQQYYSQIPPLGYN